jgi:hypothetical protein
MGRKVAVVVVLSIVIEVGDEVVWVVDRTGLVENVRVRVLRVDEDVVRVPVFEPATRPRTELCVPFPVFLDTFEADFKPTDFDKAEVSTAETRTNNAANTAIARQRSRFDPRKRPNRLDITFIMTIGA